MGFDTATGPFSNAQVPWTSQGASNWNQIIYKKIAVLGDSLSAQWPMFGASWPVLFQDRLHSAGATVQVKNFSTGGHSFFRANTLAVYGSDTAVQEVIDWKPDVVLIELGGNDSVYSAFGQGDNRTEAQIQADAQSTYTTLKAGLPSAVLIQINLRCFDENNFTTSNVKNKGILPRFMTLKAAGILTGLNTSEFLDDTCAANSRSFLDIYNNLITVITAISGVSVIQVNLFRVERLGVNLTDRTHYTPLGHSIISAYIIKALRNVTAFTDVVPVIASQTALLEGEDPDTLFTDALTASGDGYVAGAIDLQGTEDVDSSWGSARSVRADNWYLAYKASFVLDRTTVLNDTGPAGTLGFSIRGTQPNTAVSYSIDGAAFISAGYTTDQHGNILAQLALYLLNLSNAAHTFRFNIGSDVFGPFTVTLIATVIGNVNTTPVGNSGGGEDDLITYVIPAGWAFADSGRGIRVIQHGTFTSTAASKILRFYFGTANILTGGFSTNMAGNWHCEWTCHATGASSQRYEGVLDFKNTSSTWMPLPFEGTSTQDDGVTTMIKCTGQATNNDDIQQTFQRVYFE